MRASCGSGVSGCGGCGEIGGPAVGGIVGASTCTEPRLLRAPITRKEHANYLPNAPKEEEEWIPDHVQSPADR